ncbi:olfactory receptor 1019-like isoform X1 [Hemicordylus capensis]|uniref:olfactory receptor 1019-like isoform X1 n=1 Tax=Hemicordylus capensis TaxID=884348 RepID=UPI0023032F0F|nr:olfactory receptor 1019-like isoform X1 [Hemicordylus capensis]
MKYNHTVVTEFFLVGFMDHPELQIPLFTVFLVIYIVTLMGNLGILILTKIDAQLHTPMYFFLRNLSAVDVGYSTAIAPKLLLTFIAKNRTISFTGCAMQFFVFCGFVTTEGSLLAVMACDHFTAICNPLLFLTPMPTKLCVAFVTGAYICGTVNSAVHIVLIFGLSFCNSNVINHFFCDTPPILKPSCSDTHITDIVHFILPTIIALTTFLIILVSYMHILSTILRIHSIHGRRKAFSTCASHLTVVVIFYGTIIFMYLRPSSSFSMDQDKVVSVFYTLVIPMLNPLIYSLRNKDVKDDLRRVVKRMVLTW